MKKVIILIIVALLAPLVFIGPVRMIRFFQDHSLLSLPVMLGAFAFLTFSGFASWESIKDSKEQGSTSFFSSLISEIIRACSFGLVAYQLYVEFFVILKIKPPSARHDSYELAKASVGVLSACCLIVCLWFIKVLLKIRSIEKQHSST